MSYTPEQRAAAIEKVVDGLSKGTPLTIICSEDGMPNDDTMRIWANADEEIAGAIARAREVGFDVIASEALEIIDQTPERVITITGEDRSESRFDGAAVQWAKNRAEMRLKLLAKWDPKRYGEMLKHAGHDGGPMSLVVSEEDAGL